MSGTTTIFLLLILLSSSPTQSLSFNITVPLVKSKNFTIFSSLLTQTQLDNDLQAFTSGMTMFVPVDEAFYHLSKSDHHRFANLSRNEKYYLAKAHILQDYINLHSLQSSPGFLRGTLASLDMGSFLLNISKINGSIQIDTGIVRGIITRTVYDHKPFVIFAVSKVLLPIDLFGNNSYAPPPSTSSPPLGTASTPFIYLVCSLVVVFSSLI